MGCGNKINYDLSVAIVATKQEVQTLNTEKFFLCAMCGTSVDRLVALGMKWIIDIEQEDPRNAEILEIDLLPAAHNEKKN